VVSGGSGAGLEPGQRYFVRRLIKAFGNMRGPDDDHPLPVHTAAWIQIIGVDTMLATATIIHACEGILLDDYLEPFVAPMIPVGTDTGNKPDYEHLETARFLKRHGITRFRQNPFFPVNTLTIMRGAIAAQKLGVFERYVDEIYRHMWSEPKKLSACKAR